MKFCMCMMGAKAESATGAGAGAEYAQGYDVDSTDGAAGAPFLFGLL